MCKVIFSVFLLLFSSFASSNITSRPLAQYEPIALDRYKWLHDFKVNSLSVDLMNDADNIISEDEIERYFKLKTRNFIKDVKIEKNYKDETYNYNFMGISLNLIKYNDKTKIYYGMISLDINPSVTAKKGSLPYTLSSPIAGSRSQLYDFIKRYINQFVEVYAEDYYYIEDLKNKKKS